ncbi:MAG: hypothetical protein JWM11_8007 [Planctomycetaceae bacterium]|nr:hypothetical protein [Planctomycetaceae bacterium]
MCRISFEFVIHGDLKSIGEPIVHVGHSNDAHQFAKHGVSHAFVDCRRSVRSDTVFATIADADRKIDQFTYQRVQFTGATHDLFECFPSPFQSWRMVGDGLPKVIDFIRFASGSDVIKDFSYQPCAVFIFDKWLNGRTPVAKYY